MKEVKIQIPDNCELVKDGDNYVVREKKQNPPRSWDEFCEKYSLTDKEAFIDSYSNIKPPCMCGERKALSGRNWCASKEEAEAFLALMQLRQLRKAWVGDWEVSARESYGVIYSCCNNPTADINTTSRRTLSFPTKEMAEDFLSCFKDLCETAKILL